MHYPSPDFEQKIIQPEQLAAKLSSIQTRQPLVFTNGCFDILHRGHVTYLAQARSLGQALFVALNTDDSVRKQGKNLDIDRPVNRLEDRLAVVASLAAVDYVSYFASDTPLELILLLRPQILVKGGDWSIDKIVGSKEVLAYGGAVHSIPFMFNTSTTKLIAKVRT